MKVADATARASLFGSSRFVTADGKGERQQGRSSTALVEAWRIDKGETDYVGY